MSRSRATARYRAAVWSRAVPCLKRQALLTEFLRPGFLLHDLVDAFFGQGEEYFGELRRAVVGVFRPQHPLVGFRSPLGIPTGRWTLRIGRHGYNSARNRWPKPLTSPPHHSLRDLAPGAAGVNAFGRGRHRVSPPNPRPAGSPAACVSALSRGGRLEFFEDDPAGQDVLYGSFEELRIPPPHGFHIRGKFLREIHDDVDEAAVGRCHHSQGYARKKFEGFALFIGTDPGGPRQSGVVQFPSRSEDRRDAPAPASRRSAPPRIAGSCNQIVTDWIIVRYVTVQ